jgi:hypothetical protein
LIVDLWLTVTVFVVPLTSQRPASSPKSPAKKTKATKKSKATVEEEDDE